jgi:rubrerythrin
MESMHQAFDPGSTPESRESDRHLQAGQDLMTRYAGGRGKIKFDDDEDGGRPYYERDHALPNGNHSGWYAKHYGGASANVYHRATPDEAQDLIRFPEHPEDQGRATVPRLHPDFDDISLQKSMDEWHNQNPGENGTREYYETSDSEPRIRRWKQRYPNGRPPAREGSLDLMAHFAAHYETPADHPFFRDNPVSSQNVTDAYHDSSDDEKEQGRRWYSDAHHVATAIAGGDSARGAGLLAAYSPRTPWPQNMWNASKAHREDRAFGGPGEGAMGVHRKLAEPIIAGAHHSEAFSGSAPKISAFAHLIEHGGDTDDDVEHGTQKVVVDRHALSAAAGRRMSDEDLDKAPLGKHRYYEHVADSYRQAAADLTHVLGNVVSPHQVQAVVWLRQVRKNAEEDATARGAVGKGRNQRNENARDRWQETRRQHHPEIGEENMHYRGSKLAYGETTVPPQVDTLRQEACPVCGESEVWTGQRCPVCGFVAPPDLFRDPDLTKAQQMRDQAGPQEDGPVPGFPQGPADEQQLREQGQPGQPQDQAGSFPDADAQLFHPDQITPNGVPAGAPDLRQQEGDLPPSPEEELEQGEEEAQAGEEEAQQGEEDEELDQQGIALGCPACGASFAPGEQGAQDGSPCPACGQAPLAPVDEDGDAGKVQEPQGGSPMAPRQSGTPRTAAQAIAARLAEAESENRILRGQLRFLAEMAGVGPEIDQIRRRADLMNPGQPVPDPPEQPPVQTTEEALASGAPTGSGNGMHRGPGHTEDDPSRPGATPGSMTAVPAEQTTTAITPGVEIQTPPANQLIDVTAPVQGTNPSQDGGVPLSQRRIETDVRVNPNPLAAEGPGLGGVGDNGTAFPWMLDARQPGAQGGSGGGQQGYAKAASAGSAPRDPRRQPHGSEAEVATRTWASMRLGKLRVQAGLARGDDLDVGGQIERDASLSTEMIEHEIGVLSMVARSAPRQQAVPVRRMAARQVPSMAAPPAPPMAMVGAYAPSPYAPDDSDLFD